MVEVARAGINFADTHATRNDYLAEQSLPLVPGAEIGGRTPDGRRVAALLGSGGYAEKVVVPESLLIPLPDEVDDDQAAALLLQGLTAMALVQRCARIEPGETIVVEAAAGGTGTLAVQLAKRAGAKVIGLASSEEKRELVEGSAPTPASTPAPRTSRAAIREANGGERVDAVLHMSGGDAFDAEMGVLAPLGRMVVFGIASREQREVSTAALLRGSKAVIGFWLVHLLARRDLAVPMIGELLGAVAAGELRGDRRRRLPALRGGAGPRRPDRPPHQRQAPPGPLEVTTPFHDLGLSPHDPAGARRARLRGADADPGAGDPGAARRPRRDRPGPDRDRQDRRLRPAAAAVPRPREQRGAGDRPHPDPRALHPGDAGAARLRRAPRHRDRRRLRRRPDPLPAVAAALRRPRRRRHRRPHEGPDVAPLAGPHRGPLRRPRRGRRDARPRLHRGRREDPADVPERAPDGALLGDDAAADPEARRGLHVRPDDDPDHAEDADRRRDRPGLRRGPGQRQGGAPGRAAEDRRTRAGDHLHPHQDRRLEAGEDAEGQRPRREGAARRPQPGRPRRGDDRLQGPPREAAGRDRHRRPRARHRARHPRHQLRRAELLGDLRPPHRPHRPGRAHRPRDHLRHPRPARRDRPHRARREDHDRRVGDPGGAARARAAPAPPRAPERSERSKPSERGERSERVGPSERRRAAEPRPSRGRAVEAARPSRQRRRGRRRAERDTVKLFVNRGERSGIEEEDLRWALREGAVLPEEAIHESASCTASPSSRSPRIRPSVPSSSSTAPSSKAKRSGSRSPRAERSD